MHFAIVTETYPPEVNGVALTVHDFEQGLRRLGHRVRLVRPRQHAIEEVPDETVLVRGAPIPHYPGLRFGLPAGRQLARSWRADRPDAVYVATEGPLGWSATRVARNLGIPVATGFHTRFDDYVARYGAAFLSPLAFAWLRRFHNGGDATLVPTAELRQFLHGRGFRRVELLPRAVDTGRFSPAHRDPALRAEWGLGEEDLAALYVGRVAQEKNLALAVRAFGEIRRQLPSARFVFVGDGPERARLAARNPDFLFVGVRRGEDLSRHFASGDLFLFPSRSETFGNVTLEAMASGVPTVAFDYGAAREYLVDGRHGAALPLHDEDGFVAAAVHLGTDASLRKAAGLAAREAVSGLDPASVCRRFGELLGALARERRAA
ncbi:MAG TPA: glycosyltransferase family 1 protein [Xanthomonadaceae bacterium]|nr:glycosyltransferase family 1 protein [Xanthomonadaceae bacterium]